MTISPPSILPRCIGVVLVFMLFGLTAALVLYLNQDKAHESKARIMIRYVAEGNGSDDRRRVAEVVNTERGLLASTDVVRKTVQRVGPDRIHPGASVEEASAMIRDSLRIETGSQSNWINLYLQHADPEMARAIRSKTQPPAAPRTSPGVKGSQESAAGGGALTNLPQRIIAVTRRLPVFEFLLDTGDDFVQRQGFR